MNRARQVWTRIFAAVCVCAALTVSGLTTPASPAVAAIPVTPVTPIVGVNYHGLWDDYTPDVRSAVLTRLQRAGVKWVRMDVSWAMLQPDGPGRNDKWGVAQVDQRLDELSAHGIQAMVMLYWPPKWSSGTGGKNGEPADPADYGRILGWAAERWHRQAPVWEMWNEPDKDEYYASASPERFAAMIKAAYPIAKTLSPRSTFVLGAPTYLGLAKNWFQRLYAAGIAGSYDAIGIHPYMAPSNSHPDLQSPSSRDWAPAGIPKLRRLMTAHGEGNVPLWATEFGWSTHKNKAKTPTWRRGVSKRNQAVYTLAGYRELARYGVVGAFVYSDRNMTHRKVHEAKYGILNRANKPKPAYYAVKCAASGVCRKNLR